MQYTPFNAAVHSSSVDYIEKINKVKLQGLVVEPTIWGELNYLFGYREGYYVFMFQTVIINTLAF